MKLISTKPPLVASTVASFHAESIVRLVHMYTQLSQLHINALTFSGCRHTGIKIKD